MKTAIVGCGNIASVHAACIKELSDCEIVGFADVIKERAESFANQYGGKAYLSLEEMLAKEHPDILHICTPHYLHVPMAICGLRAGIHVFMEKPPVITAGQLEELKEAVEASDSRLGVCFQNRYNQSVQFVKQLLSSGGAGKIKGGRGLVTWHRDQEYYVQSGWRGKLATEGGGALTNQSVHTLDLLKYFLGDVCWVEADMKNHHLKDIIEVEDTVEAYLQFQDAAASFYATTAYCDDAPPLIEIRCEKMTIRIEDPQVTLYHSDGRIEHPDLPVTKLLGKSYWGSGHLACIKDFYACLQSGKRFSLDLQEVESTARLMLAVYESAREGRVIALEKGFSNI